MRNSSGGGNAPAAVDRPPEAPGWVIYAVLALFLLVVHAVLTVFLVPHVLRGELIDTDSYTRLIRVAQLQAGGNWYDTVIPRMNAPLGLDFHWTRPLDFLLLLLAWPLSPFLGFERALHFAGVFVSPLLHVITSISLAWAVAPLFKARHRPLVIIVLLAQPVLTSYALAGRADHHMLQVLAYVLTLGYFLRAVGWARAGRAAMASGALAGFGLWVSIEALLPLLTLFGALGILWLAGYPNSARKSLDFSVGLVGVVALALLVEHPLGTMLLPEYDKISAPHLLAALLALGFWAAILTITARVKWMDSLGGRVLFVLVSAGMAVPFVAWVYPGLLQNPLKNVDPEFWELYVRHFAEFQSFLSGGLPEIGNGVAHFGSALVAVPFGIWMLSSRHSTTERATWLPVALGLLAFVPLALYQVRFGVWAGVPVAVGVAGFLAMCNERLDGVFSAFRRTLSRVVLNAAVITGFMFLGAGGLALWGDSSGLAEKFGGGGCVVGDMLETLGGGRFGESSLTLLAGGDYGPELVYRTPHSVLAAPYHRNADGNLHPYRILTATDESESLRLIKERGIDLLILCPSREEGFYEQRVSSEETLFRRLVDGRLPLWLRPVELLGIQGSGFRVFEVMGS